MYAQENTTWVCLVIQVVLDTRVWVVLRQNVQTHLEIKRLLTSAP
jgi:hypothetical protein